MDNESYMPSRIHRIKVEPQIEPKWWTRLSYKLVAAMFSFFICSICLCGAIIGTLPDQKSMTQIDYDVFAPNVSNNDTYTMGIIKEPVVTKNLTWTLLDVFYIDKPDYLEDTGDYVYIATEIYVTNVSNDPQDIYLNIWVMKDDQDRQYGQDYLASATLEKGTIGGTLVPGDSMRGMVVFKVLPSDYYRLIMADMSKQRIMWEIR